MIDYDEQKKSITEFDNGNLLVRCDNRVVYNKVLVERVNYLLNKEFSRTIYILTPSQSLASEVKQIIDDETGREKNVYVSSVGEFCRDIIDRIGFYVGYDTQQIGIYNNDVRKKLVKDLIYQDPIINSLYSEYKEDQQEVFIDKTVELITKIKRNMISEESLNNLETEDIVLKTYYAYCNRMKYFSVPDYYDLIYDVLKAFSIDNSTQYLYAIRFIYMIVVGVEQLSKVEYTLVKSFIDTEKISEIPKIFTFIGNPDSVVDDNKNIFKDIVNDFQPTILSLDENTKYSKSVLTLANKVIPNSIKINPDLKEGVFKITKYKDPTEEAENVAQKIMELIKLQNVKDISNPVTYENITIIARKKYALLDVEKALTKYDIPYNYSYTLKGHIFDSYYEEIFVNVLIMRVYGLNLYIKDELSKLLKIKECDTIEELLSEVKDPISHFVIETVSVLKEDCSDFADRINKICNLFVQESKKHNLDECTKEEYNVAILNFSQVLEIFYLEERKNGKLNIKALYNIISDEYKLYGTSLKDVVVLNTCETMRVRYSDKQIVFLVGADDLTFPNYKAVKEQGYALDLERSNMYSAITTARSHIYISYPEYRGKPFVSNNKRDISRFLK